MTASIIGAAQRQAARVVGLGYMAPMGVFEITMGFWLLLKGLAPPRVRDIK